MVASMLGYKAVIVTQEGALLSPHTGIQVKIGDIEQPAHPRLLIGDGESPAIKGNFYYRPNHVGRTSAFLYPEDTLSVVRAIRKKGLMPTVLQVRLSGDIERDMLVHHPIILGRRIESIVEVDLKKLENQQS